MHNRPTELNDLLKQPRPQYSLIGLLFVAIVMTITWSDWYTARASRLVAQNPRYRMLGVVLAVTYCATSVIYLVWAGRSWPLVPPNPQ